jgi:predicted glycosyltransferase
MLFTKLTERLKREGHQVLQVTREYREVVELLKQKSAEAIVVGRHGGETLPGKLTASLERTLKLTSIIAKLQPDVAVSFSSPELSRVAFGLKLPHVCLNDSPHAEAVARLTIPLASFLLTPQIIPKSTWTKYGISPSKIVQYKALDAWAWLKDFRPNEKVLAQLGLDKTKPIVAFRTEESFASYLLGKTGRTPLLLPLIKGLISSDITFQAVVIPRYEAQTRVLKRELGKRIKICEYTIDAPSLLYYASVFVGAGGTMTTEAALMGIPTFSCYPDKPFLVERYLIKKGLVARETSLKTVEEKVIKALREIDSVKRTQRAKAKKVTDMFEDPIDVIARAVEAAK